jgi:chromosome segregation ATPase
MKKYEIMYEEARLQLAESDSAKSQVLQQLEYYKKQCETVEHKYNKVVREQEQALGRLAELEMALLQAEKDLQDTRQSENNAKRQMQNELIEAKRKEEDIRVQAQREESEFKKREAYMKEQWLKDLQDKERSEEEWEHKFESLSYAIKEGEATVRERDSVIA